MNRAYARVLGVAAGIGLSAGYVGKLLYINETACPIEPEGEFFVMLRLAALAALFILGGAFIADWLLRKNEAFDAYLSSKRGFSAFVLPLCALAAFTLCGSLLYWNSCRYIVFTKLSNIHEIEYRNLNTYTFKTIDNGASVDGIVTLVNTLRGNWVSPTPGFSTPAQLRFIDRKRQIVATIHFGDGGIVREGALLMGRDSKADARALCRILNIPISGVLGNSCV